MAIVSFDGDLDCFAITNAVNLIDGLDGLVSGVSIISLVTMGIVSYFFLPVQISS